MLCMMQGRKEEIPSRFSMEAAGQRQLSLFSPSGKPKGKFPIQMDLSDLILGPRFCEGLIFENRRFLVLIWSGISSTVKNIEYSQFLINYIPSPALEQTQECLRLQGSFIHLHLVESCHLKAAKSQHELICQGVMPFKGVPRHGIFTFLKFPSLNFLP